MFDEEESIESDEGDREGGEENARRLCCRHKLAHILLNMCLLMALMRVLFCRALVLTLESLKALPCPEPVPNTC